MDAEIVFVPQGRQGQLAGDSRRKMDGRTVFHEIGDKLRDVLHSRKIRQGVGRQELFLLFHQAIDLVDMEHSVTGNPGHAGLTWAMTTSAACAAARVISTETPRFIQPKSSGGATCTRA